MPHLEMLVGRAWLPLRRDSGGSQCPQVPESSALLLRGLDSGEIARIGPLEISADSHGCIELRLRQTEELLGHLGLVEICRESGELAGEFEIVPDKMSDESYRSLRSALEQIWTGLIFDPEGVSRLRGQLPSPAELWHAIEKPIREIAAEPRSLLSRGEGIKRLGAVRRPSELTVSVLRASAASAQMAAVSHGHQTAPHVHQSASHPSEHPSEHQSGHQSEDHQDPYQDMSRAEQVARPGRAGVMIRDVDIPENALVAETLRRLASYARRQPNGLEVATRASRALRSHPFDSCRLLRGGAEAARIRTLHDPRYRQVDKVLRLLDRPEAHATEGPGEVRLGVKGLIRLYEYWVFLQVLEACRQKYGPPIDPGFDILGRRTRTGTTFLEIPKGAIVRFPGDVHVAFEPQITSSGSGWQQLENVPHPDRGLAQNLITPDVVVLRRAPIPTAVVFDAKYVGRHWVEFEAAKIHARYSRMRLQGKPVVRHVVAAHPHEGIEYMWAGYGSVPMIPGKPTGLRELLP